MDTEPKEVPGGEGSGEIPLAFLPLARLFRPGGNKKTGPIHTSITAKNTCPATCPLKGNGCYAENPPLLGLWNRVGRLCVDKSNTDTLGHTWPEFVRSVNALPANVLWRHNVAGDLPGDGERIDHTKLVALAAAARKTYGFTFTHYPLTLAHNRDVIDFVNKETKRRGSGLVINVEQSAVVPGTMKNTPRVRVVESSYEYGPWSVVDGASARPTIVCPAARKGPGSKDVTCAACGACANPNRLATIAFPAHGARKRAVERVLEEKYGG